MSRWPGSGGASGSPRPRLRPRPLRSSVLRRRGSPTPAPSPSSASSVQRSLPLWIRLVGPSALSGHLRLDARLVRADAGRAAARSGRSVGFVLVAEQSLRRTTMRRKWLDLVEAVDPQRLPVDVVQERLHAGEALALLRGRLVRRRRGEPLVAAGRPRPSACGRRSSGGTGAAASPSRGASSDSSRSSAISSADSVSAFRPDHGRLARVPASSRATRSRTAPGRRAGGGSRAPRRASGAGTGSARRRWRRAGRAWAAARRGSVGSLFHCAWRLSARDAWISAVSIASCAQRESCSFFGSTAALTLSASVMKSRIVSFWRSRISSVSLTSLQRRMRAADDLVQLLGPPGQARRPARRGAAGSAPCTGAA